MYIETSTGNQGAKARLLTPFFVNRGTKCIRFYYHMYGASIGTLNVYARFFFFRFKLWSKSGNQNNTWHLAQVEYKRSFSFQVRQDSFFNPIWHGGLFHHDIIC